MHIICSFLGIMITQNNHLSSMCFGDSNRAGVLQSILNLPHAWDCDTEGAM